jgi:hypothetical protein
LQSSPGARRWLRTLGHMTAAASTQTLAARLALFLVLPVALWWGLDYIVPMSMLVTRDLFFPFVSHAGPVAHGLGMYIANGVVVIVVAVLTVIAGRTFSIWSNIGIFFGIALAAALVTHAALNLLGFPFQGDAP